jgi:hypothetical protein
MPRTLLAEVISPNGRFFSLSRNVCKPVDNASAYEAAAQLILALFERIFTMGIPCLDFASISKFLLVTVSNLIYFIFTHIC